MSGCHNAFAACQRSASCRERIRRRTRRDRRAEAQVSVGEGLVEGQHAQGHRAVIAAGQHVDQRHHVEVLQGQLDDDDKRGRAHHRRRGQGVRL